MATTPTIPEHFPTEFTTNWEHKVQTIGGKIAEYATLDPSFKGKKKWYNQIDDIDSMDQITSRISSTQLTEMTTSKYWLQTSAFDKAKGFDEWDDELLGDIALPDSETITELSNVWKRQVDTTLLTELLGTRYIGETGTTTDALPSGQKVAVTYVESGSAVNSGLTYHKILRALEIFGDNDVDFSMTGPPIMWLRMRQITDLYRNVTEFRSRDFSSSIEPFNRDKLITEGSMNWMGIQIYRSQLVANASATDITSVPMYVKPGLKYAITNDTALVDIRPDLRHALQIRCRGRIGAVRTQNEYVVEIACDESP